MLVSTNRIILMIEVGSLDQQQPAQPNILICGKTSRFLTNQALSARFIFEHFFIAIRGASFLNILFHLSPQTIQSRL